MITYRIRGLTELLEAERTVGAKTQGALTEKLHDVGEIVASDVRRRYQPYSPSGGSSVQTKVFASSGLWVVQTRRKSRDIRRRRPNFPRLMMRRAFLPAAKAAEPRVLAAAEQAVAEVRALYWDRVGG